MDISFEEVKNKLDKKGCGMCLAKWTQVTLHLDKGMTHSCHHPVPHKIPLREIENNPSALHNTRHKKKRRKEMLEGRRPKECNYCWGVEDTSNQYSDRIFKSSEPWSYDQLEKISSSRWNEDYNPRYVEVSFSNTCNFKCAYCGPQFSSKWVEEIEKHGPYNTSTKFNNLESIRDRDEMPYKQLEHNPYVEAFWDWWPNLFPDLHTFRITGGEPLLSPNTFKVLTYIQENYEKNPNLSLAINTNLGVPDALIDKLITIVKDLVDNNKVREVIIFTSVEATKQQAEYTRFGLDYDKFWINIDKILSKIPKITVNIMATFNALSVFSYDDLLDKVVEVKTKHDNGIRNWNTSLMLDTSYLRWPPHLSVKILEEEHKELILKSAIKAMYYGANSVSKIRSGFNYVEIQKIKRIYDYAISKDGFDVEKSREDFSRFIEQYDKRRGTNFEETFPELVELYKKYKS